MLIDTHAHLWFDDYSIDLEQVIERAKLAGVEKMIVPGTDFASSKKAIELAKKYPGVIYAAVGVHPEELLNRNFEESPLWLRELLGNAVAIGEIGTDASTEELRSCMDEQKELFKAQCELALEHDLPVIIHTRDSFEETWEVLTSLPKMPRGQFHCFSVDETALKMVVEHGFCVSFCGNITWSKRVAKLVSLVPDDRLLLETDSPFMMPRDKKGESVHWGANGAESSDLSFASLQTAGRSELEDRNEPSNVRLLAEKIAELRGQSLEKIAEMTTKNAKTLYRL